MNLAEVKKILENHFNEPPLKGAKRNIIFWYDEEGNLLTTLINWNWQTPAFFYFVITTPLR